MRSIYEYENFDDITLGYCTSQELASLMRKHNNNLDIIRSIYSELLERKDIEDIWLRKKLESEFQLNPRYVGSSELPASIREKYWHPRFGDLRNDSVKALSNLVSEYNNDRLLLKIVHLRLVDYGLDHAYELREMVENLYYKNGYDYDPDFSIPPAKFKNLDLFSFAAAHIQSASSVKENDVQCKAQYDNSDLNRFDPSKIIWV